MKDIRGVILGLTLGVLFVILEFVTSEILPFTSRITILSLYSIVAVALVTLLIIVTKDFGAIGWFQISSCGGLLLFLIFILLTSPNLRIDYDTVYLLSINFIIPAGVVVTTKLLSRKDRFINYVSYFKTVSILFLFFYIAVLGYTLFGKSYGSIRSINLVPFKTIGSYLFGIARVNSNIAFINLLANVLLLVPLGFYLEVFFRDKKFIWKLALIVAAPIILETMQYLLWVGSSDIDDWILNTIGGLCGIAIFHILNRLYKIIHKTESKLFLWE